MDDATPVGGAGNHDAGASAQAVSRTARSAPSAPKRFADWAQAHDRMFSFIGATLVLATFVVKDQKRDRLREVVNSIQSAQTFVQIRGDLSMLQMQSFNLSQMMVFPNAKDQYDPDPKDLAGAQLESARMSVIQMGGRANLQHVADMLEHVPAPEQTRNELNDLQQRSDNLSRHLISLGETLQVPHMSPPGPAPHLPLTSETRFALKAVQQESAPLSMDIAKFVSKTIEDADRVRKSNETELGFWSVASNVLFFMGWLLGLVGKLSGVNIMPAAD